MAKVFYLAGPMSGIEGYNSSAFEEAAAELRTRNFEIVSPWEIAQTLPGKPGSLPYETYVKADIIAMLRCDAIILMKGWEESRGARMECNLADWLGMHIFHVNSEWELTLSRRFGNQDVTTVF